jgi:hypothetical protein
MSLEELLKEKKDRIDVGDLLRLKRHEKPDPAFWDTFEQQLAGRSLRHAMGRGSRWEHLWTTLSAQWRLLASASAATTALALVALSVLHTQSGPQNTTPTASAPQQAGAGVPSAAAAKAQAASPAIPDERFLESLAASAPSRFPVRRVVTLPDGGEDFERVAARQEMRAREATSERVHYMPGLIASNLRGGSGPANGGTY